jgi:hypothetical protein
LSLRSPSHVCVCNIIPLPVNIIPTLKYHIKNIAGRLISFLFENIFPIVYKKQKEKLVFVLRIKKTNHKA